MKKTFNIYFIILTLIIFIFPRLSIAVDTGLIPCTENCGFNDFMQLINNFVDFILFKLTVPIAAICFAYAGFLMITSGGEVSKKTKAKNILVNVVLGFIFALAAWLIINTILSVLGYDGAWIGF